MRRTRHSASDRAVAVFVLFAGSAGAGIVSARIAPGLGIGLVKSRGKGLGCRRRRHAGIGNRGRGGFLRPGVPVAIVFGQPMSIAEFDDPAAGKDRYQVASERIMARIAALPRPPVNVL